MAIGYVDAHRLIRYRDGQARDITAFAGDMQAVDELGNFQVPGLETDLVLCIRLVVEVIRFNFADFFADGGLLDSVGGLLGMSRSSTEE